MNRDGYSKFTEGRKLSKHLLRAGSEGVQIGAVVKLQRNPYFTATLEDHTMWLKSAFEAWYDRKCFGDERFVSSGIGMHAAAFAAPQRGCGGENDALLEHNLQSCRAISQGTLCCTSPGLEYEMKFSFFLTAAQREIRKFNEQNNLPLRWAQTKNMPITYKVVLESLRVASIISFTFREAMADVEYKGYLIPKGWKVMPLFRNIHDNPEFFSHPQKFDPSRFEMALMVRGSFVLYLEVGPVNYASC
ncbi:hypothetical protein FNV43_RR00472 [Rhamnella rubrinervis]|uniref:Uncharacterized protein n=1 Tax=Rhamnella rubrinervis TaxID=2594499 RepID=A0A8K0HNQ6_9ROSA|nr:hypothetical protein FNV43_RR00472 [Rhamnella rubrinervis]